MSLTAHQLSYFKRLTLSLPEELATALMTYHERLQGNGMGTYIPDTVRELLMIALSSDPESIIPLADRARVLTEYRVWMRTKVREILAKLEQDFEEAAPPTGPGHLHIPATREDDNGNLR